MTEEGDDAFVHALVMRVRDEFPGAEPSDLVSARILAAARAHARGRARPWWRHPGIAAAAMLVIVAGAVLWNRKGGEVAEPRRPAETQTTVVAPPAVPAPTATAAPVKQDKPVDIEAAKTPPPPPPPPPARHVAKQPEVAHGSAVGAGSSVGAAGEEDETRTATGHDAPTADSQAAQLTRQARTAAKAGQCDAVKMLGDKVKAVDASYYDYAFATDPDIKRCR